MKCRKRPPIGERIYNLRLVKGWTQQQLADELKEKCSCSRQLVNGWESGANNVTIDQLLALSDLFSVSCDYILRGIEVEYLDICKETCLKPETLAVLQEIEKETQSLAERYNQISADVDKLRYEIQGYTETLSKEEFDDLQLWPVWRNKTDQQMKALYNLAGNSGWEYIVNSFIRDKKLIGGLKRACIKINQDAYSHFRHLINGSDDTDYYASLDAAKYTAGQAFAEFFSSLCESAQFFRETTTLSDEHIQAAIERGLLHE